VWNANTLLVDHGYVVLFAYVLVSQLGVPLPSGPLIIAAGALAATGRMQVGAAVALVALASLCADSVWYQLGRLRGARVVRTLCRVSLEPEACVRRTHGAFRRYGEPFLLVAKFVPGLGLMAAPVAGQTHMRYPRFVAFDVAGALIWASAYAAIGFLLGEWIERSARLLRAPAQFGVAAIVIAVVAILAARLVRRRRFRARTATARITPHELKLQLDRGEAVYIVDLRHTSEARDEHHTLPGAVNRTPDDVLERRDLLPKDRDIVLFCDCPGEASAAYVATALQTSGFLRARPLEGGLEAWKVAGYPLALIAKPAAA
jgi:membrane protein DedA with SNARE-associated domain/rhodanese-related sulfurtransferase